MGLHKSKNLWGKLRHIQSWTTQAYLRLWLAHSDFQDYLAYSFQGMRFSRVSSPPHLKQEHVFNPQNPEQKEKWTDTHSIYTRHSTSKVPTPLLFHFQLFMDVLVAYLLPYLHVSISTCRLLHAENIFSG